jgi:hypothetical protein
MQRLREAEVANPRKREFLSKEFPLRKNQNYSEIEEKEATRM